MTKPTCSIDGCVKLAATRGWCPMHYQRWRKHGDPLYERTFDIPDCSVDGCETIHYARGWCERHYKQFRAEFAPTCSIEKCGDPVSGRGWCNKHYTRWRIHGDPLGGQGDHVSMQGKPCTIEGCEKPINSKKMCSMHYQRLRFHGDPLYVAEKPPWPDCLVEGCDKPKAVGRKGWCTSHYQRWRKYGDPTAGQPPKKQSWLTRGPYSGCWEWGGPKNETGYGTVNVSGHSSSLVHRIVYAEIYGELPDLLRHRCDNPPCYNPAHLLPGTHKSNAQDMVDRKRSSRGSKCGTAKLCEAEVLEIMTTCSRRVSAEAWAERHSVSTRTIRDIYDGRSWGWLAIESKIDVESRACISRCACTSTI